MSKQTSVDFIFEKLEAIARMQADYVPDILSITEAEYEAILTQARAMHRKEVVEAYHNAQLGIIEIYAKKIGMELTPEITEDKEDANQYYNDTFQS